MIDLRYNNPYQTTTRRERMIKQLKTPKKKVSKKQQREAERLQSKADSPGVPPNTCPYIDVVLTMVSDLQNGYDRLREKGEYNPMMDRLAQQAQDTLEYIRSCNETLRDNSAFWYNKYKDLLEKQ